MAEPEPIVVVVCGSRGWKDPTPINVIIGGLLLIAEATGARLIIIHGDEKGADKLAGQLGKQWGAEVIPEPADWSAYFPNSTKPMGRAAGPIRNQRMLDKHHPQTVWAFRASGKSSGSDDMIARAIRAGVQVYIVTDPTLEETEGMLDFDDPNG